MATVQKTIDLKAGVDSVWKKIADVGAVPDLMGFITESKLEGENRICTMADGAVLKELIVSVDDALKRVAYSITDSPLNFEFHSGSMQVLANGQGATLVWTTDVKPDAVVEQLNPLLEQAVSDMKTSLEKA